MKIPVGMTIENYRKFLNEKMECLLLFHNYGTGEIEEIVKLLIQLG